MKRITLEVVSAFIVSLDGFFHVATTLIVCLQSYSFLNISI